MQHSNIESIKKRISLEDFLHEKVRLQTVFSIYLVFFSILYLFAPKDFSITTALLIAFVLFIGSHYESKKIESNFNKVVKILCELLLIGLLSLFITFTLGELFPASSDFIFALLVFLSIFFGLIFNVGILYKALPSAKPLHEKVKLSIKDVYFLICVIAFIVYFFINYDSVVLAFNTLRSIEENILAKVGTSATVLSVGAAMLSNINRRIMDKHLSE